MAYAFDPRMRLDAGHAFEVAAVDARRCVLRHELWAGPHGWMRLGWPVALRWLHDALLEDLADNAERAATGAVVRPARHSWWVRLLRRAYRPGSGGRRRAVHVAMR